MRHTSECGRTMLETIMVMGIMGVLSVTGIYLYQRAMNDVRADGIVKDVLERASQKKSNKDFARLGAGIKSDGTAKKMVYTPEYKKYKKDGSETETTKGRYGYRYNILTESNYALVKVQTEGKSVTEGVCKAIKSKITSYKEGTFEKVVVVNDGKEIVDILTGECPSEIQNLRFDVGYGEYVADKHKPVVPPAPTPPGLVCPSTSRDDGTGDVTSNPDCRCVAPNTRWNGSSCVVPCPVGTSPTGAGNIAQDDCKCINAGESWDSVRCCPAGASSAGAGGNAGAGCKCNAADSYWDGNACVLCPTGSSLGGAGNTAVGPCKCNNSGETYTGGVCQLAACPADSSRDPSYTGDMTNVLGCRCSAVKPKWDVNRCTLRCLGDKRPNVDETACICLVGVEKTGSPNSCVECNVDSDCETGHACDNNFCELVDNDCNYGVCQTCDASGRRTNLPQGTSCEKCGMPGECNGNGICYPTGGRACSSEGGCPAGYFCNYGGNFSSGAMQVGSFGQTANVCMKVNAKQFVHESPVTHTTKTYYYNTKADLQCWCRAADNSPNCTWGYLAKPGAKSWCHSLGKRLLKKSELNAIVDKDETGKNMTLWDVLKKKLPKTYTGYSYWIEEGAWTENSKGQRGIDTGRSDGYVGKGGVVCI